MFSSTPSSSSQIMNFFSSGFEKAKEIIPAAVETVKKYNPIEISFSPQENINAWASFLSNPIVYLLCLPNLAAANFIPDDSRICFQVANIFYSLGCDKLCNGQDIQNAAMNPLTRKCAIILAPGKCFYDHFDTYEPFGKNWFGAPVCTIVFHPKDSLDPCVADVVANNTPAKTCTQDDIIKIAVIAVPAFLTGIAFISLCLWKRYSPKQEELIPILNEDQHSVQGAAFQI